MPPSNQPQPPLPPQDGLAQIPQQQINPYAQPSTGQQPQQASQQQSQPQQPGQAQQPDKAAADRKAAETNQTTTQKSLLFSELRDGMIIMADGSFRAVVACKSINFDLMSSREREGVEYSYQNFLNSLYFPIQIFVRSQRVDLAPYLERLEAMRRQQDNMLLNVLMDDYLGFVETLADEANIMDKSFFITVPYYPEGDAGKLVEQGRGFFGKFFGKQTNGVTKIDQAAYEKAKDEIKNRVNTVMSGLFQIGVHCAQLNTKELGELYYNMYNPDTAVNQPLGDFDNNTSTFVKKGEGEAARVSMQPGVLED